MALGFLTENGWPSCAASDCDLTTIPGTSERLLFQRGQPAIILAAFMGDLNQYVESVMNSAGYADEGSYTPTNSVYSSNHKGGTAFDYNWQDHPMGVALAGWGGSELINGPEEPAVRDLLAFYEGMVFWGNDWTSPKDSMHFQMGYDTYGSDNVARVQNFIDRKIRADGSSTYRRGGTARGGGQTPPQAVPATTGLTAQVLSDVMGGAVSLDRYAALLPLLLKCFDYCDANTVDRRAMMLAQIGEESGGLRWQTEIASGAEYNGRCSDLGNCQDGDGPRFKGRDFIQITGRFHYRDLSTWAFARGIVPTSTEFLARPDELGTDYYAFVGVAWYWTVERPQLNSLADARDIVGATYAVNGGQNGIDERRAIYARALAANTELLDPTDLDEWDALMADPTLASSRSPYRDSNAPTMTARDAVFGADADAHKTSVELDALRGEPYALNLIRNTANGTGAGATLWYDNTKPDQWAINHAIAFLNYVASVNPSALQGVS